MDDEIPKIGAFGDEIPPVFELIIEEHIEYVNPIHYGVHGVTGINPADYFITSGDAVEKARVLEKDLWALAGATRTQSYQIIAKENKCDIKKAQKLYSEGVRPKKPSKYKDFESAVWRAAGNSRKLLNALIKARGENIFLETEWNNHHLLCIQKNPRRANIE